MPRTTEQFELMRRERTENILNAGLYLFATHGYEQTTADAVCAIVNCSHGLLYHYFSSKEDLYKAVIDKRVRTIAANVTRGINRNQKAKFVLTDVIDSFIKHLKGDNDEFAWALALLLDIHLQGVINPKAKNIEKDKRVYDWVFELIERGKAEGDFNDLNSREQVITIIALFKGLAYNRVKIGYKKFLSPSTEIIMNIVLK